MVLPYSHSKLKTMKHAFENLIFWNTTGFFTMSIELILLIITVFNCYIFDKWIIIMLEINALSGGLLFNLLLLLFCTDLISYTWIITDIVAFRQKPLICKFVLFFHYRFYWPPFTSVHIISQWMYSKSLSPGGCLSDDTQGVWVHNNRTFCCHLRSVAFLISTFWLHANGWISPQKYKSISVWLLVGL